MNQQNSIKAIEKEIDETKHLLKNNTEKLLERDSHLEELEHKSASLALSSGSFRAKTKKLSTRMCFQKYFPLLLAILFCFIVLIIIITSSSRHK